MAGVIARVAQLHFPSVAKSTPGRRTVLVGVADALLERRSLPARGRVAVDDSSLVLQYVPESLLSEADLEPDIRIAVPRRDACCAPLFLTLMGEMVQQDQALRLYIDGALQEPGPLRLFGSGQDEGQLRLGRAAILVVGTQTSGGWRIRLGMSAPLLWVYSMPSVADPRPRLDGWMDEASRRTRDRVA